MAEEKGMTLLDHIQELRRRLFRAVAAIIITTLAASTIVDYVVAWLVKPLGGALVIALSPTEAPITYFKVALAIGFGVSLPYILYQIYGFLAPGLFPNERKTFLFGIPAALVFFVLGGLFTLQVLMPISMPVLMGFFGTVVTPSYSLERYLGFTTTLALCSDAPAAQPQPAARHLHCRHYRCGHYADHRSRHHAVGYWPVHRALRTRHSLFATGGAPTCAPCGRDRSRTRGRLAQASIYRASQWMTCPVFHA
jgi:Tat protein translocase TatC